MSSKATLSPYDNSDWKHPTPKTMSHHPPPALLTEGSSQDVSRKSTWPELHHERQSFSCLGIHMLSPLLCLRSRLTGTAAELNNQAGKLTSCKDLLTLIYLYRQLLGSSFLAKCHQMRSLSTNSPPLLEALPPSPAVK